MRLHTYEGQVATLKRWMKLGLCERAGTWRSPQGSGDIWHGKGFNYHWQFHTQGRMLVPGTFRVRCLRTPHGNTN
jgi:hypothetical protein